MAKYLVRSGCRFGAAKQFGPGEVVELDPEHAASFMDKLEPLAVEATGLPVEPAKKPVKPPPPPRPMPDNEVE